MKAIPTLRTIPFILLGFILFAKAFFPEFSTSHSRYYQPVVLSFCLISIVIAVVLFQKKAINKNNLYLLLIGAGATTIIFFHQYLNH